MTAPTFVSATATANNTTASKTTASIAVQNGDVLVAFGYMENGTQTYAIATATGSTSAWTLQEDTAVGASLNNPYCRAWTATATATGNITVTFSGSAALASLGLVKVWRNSGGIGAKNRADNGTGSGSPSVGVTTTGANSALDFADCDWSGVTGAATFTASSGTPVQDLSDQTLSANYCIYSAHVLDAGAIGAKTFGMSAPTGQRYICDVIEILGSASAAVNIGSSAPMFAPRLGPAKSRFKPRLAFPAANQFLTLSAAQGTFIVSGTAATPNAARSLAAAQGTYLLSGKAATLNRGIVMPAAKGTFVVNGVPAALSSARSLTAAQGSFVVNGQGANLLRGRTVVATQGTFTVNGQPASFPIALSLLAAKGTFVVNGQGAALVFTPASGGAAVSHSNPFFSTPGPGMSLP